MKRLGVNIDHVATVRNARGEKHPDPLNIARKAIKFGADSITIHLREDRRHIKDEDLKKISKLKIPLNLEIGCNQKMIEIALRNKPNFICLVPEKRNEITTEGGLNLEKISENKLRSLLSVCHSNGIELSAFINPNKKAINLAKKLKFQTVELHTGSLDKIKINNKDKEKINNMIDYASNVNLKVNIGHGLNFSNIKFIKNRKKIDTVHIGHFIISEAIFLSLNETIKKFQRII